MKISKDSWHYKLNKFFDSSICWEDRVSLCSYFWKTIIFLIVSSLVVLTSVALAYVLLNLVFGILLGLLGLELAIINVDLMLGTLTIGFILSCCYGFVLLVETILGNIPWLPQYISKRLPEKKAKEAVYVEKKPSIFKEYYKAYKSKFCPYVEIE